MTTTRSSVIRAVYRFGCGAVVSSSWWNSYIFWVKATYQGKVAMRISEDWSGPLVTCTGNTGRSPVLTGELVPVDWHRLPVQVTNGPDRSSEVLINLNPEVDVGGGGGSATHTK